MSVFLCYRVNENRALSCYLNYESERYFHFVENDKVIAEISLINFLTLISLTPVDNVDNSGKAIFH